MLYIFYFALYCPAKICFKKMFVNFTASISEQLINKIQKQANPIGITDSWKATVIYLTNYAKP